jgi:hypothetical protein
VDPDTTPTASGRPAPPTAATAAIRREAERFARRNPAERPKWTQYRTAEQEHIIEAAAVTRRNLRSQAKRLGFGSVERMLDAWLPNAMEVFDRMEAPEAQAIGIVLERIAVALEAIAESGRGLAAAAPPPIPANLGSWRCPVHKVGKVMPAGFSQRTQKAYAAFEKCPIQLPDGSWCNERPPRGWVGQATTQTVTVNGAEHVALNADDGAMEALMP